MKTFWRNALFLALLVGVALPRVLSAQIAADVSKGSISVLVQDPSQAVIPNATVTIRGPAGEQRAATNERGEAFFYNLTLGDYRIRTEVQGFRAWETTIAVRANQRSPLIARLEGAPDQRAEGRRICVELLQELAEIKGIAGAHLMAPRQEQACAEAIAESGLLGRRRAA